MFVCGLADKPLKNDKRNLASSRVKNVNLQSGAASPGSIRADFHKHHFGECSQSFRSNRILAKENSTGLLLVFPKSIVQEASSVPK